MEISTEKNQIVKKDAVRFGVKVTIKFEFDFKIFSIANKQYKLFCVKLW